MEEKKTDRKPTQIINRDLLKYIAVLLMTIGHWAFDLYKIIKVKWFLQVAVAVQFFAPPVTMTVK